MRPQSLSKPKLYCSTLLVQLILVTSPDTSSTTAISRSARRVPQTGAFYIAAHHQTCPIMTSHHHHHHHHQNNHLDDTHQHDHDVVHQNQEYFDKEASTYDIRHVGFMQLLNKEIRANKDFIGADWSATTTANSAATRDAGSAHATAAAPAAQATAANDSVGGATAPVRLLDYACGTGAMSRALGDLVDECVGIDISPQMVEIYNKRAQGEVSLGLVRLGQIIGDSSSSNQGFTNEKRFAVQGNLAIPSDPEPVAFADPKLYNDFAIAIVGGGFHHFEHPELAAERLVQRLRPGGVLAIWDFFTHDHSDSKDHGAAHTIVKHGFSEKELNHIFTKAGAGEGFQVLDLGEHVMENRGKKITRRIFLARGQKARPVS